MKTEETVKMYDACIVICNWRYTTFNGVNPQGKNSADRILQAGMSVKTQFLKIDNKTKQESIIKEYSFDAVSDKFDLETYAVPVRICGPDEANLICSDWCTSGSPFKELNYDSIPRWWPESWIRPNNKNPDKIIIDLGKLGKEHIVLNCRVIQKPTQEIMCTSFADIYIEGVDEIIPTFDRRINNDTDKVGDIGSYDTIGADMFGFKKNKEKSAVSKILETAEQINEPEKSVTTKTEKTVVEYTKTTVIEDTDDVNPKVEETKDMEENMSESTNETAVVAETNETAPAAAPKAKRARRVPTWAKVVGGVVIVAAATTATVMIVNKVKSTTPAK